MPDDDNEKPGGFFFAYRRPPQDDFHQSLEQMAANCARWSLEEYERVYAEQEVKAEEWNKLLVSDDVSPQTCIAGVIRNSVAGRTARRLAKNITAFDPEKGHHYSARAYEHHAAYERWQGKLGKLTQLEHTHAPEPPAPPDGKSDNEGPRTPLPDWLK